MYTPKRSDSRRRARNATEPESGPSDCSCQRGVAAQPPPHFQAATGTVQWFTLELTIARAPASNCSALQQQHAVLTTNQLTGAGLLPCKSKSALDREVAAVPASAACWQGRRLAGRRTTAESEGGDTMHTLPSRVIPSLPAPAHMSHDCATRYGRTAQRATRCAPTTRACAARERAPSITDQTASTWVLYRVLREQAIY